MKYRVWAVVLLVFTLFLGSLVYASRENDYRVGPVTFKTFKLGLDLSGGTELTYVADVSETNPAEIKEAMGALRNVIERRVNLFGVSEPIVQVENTGFFGGDERHQLVVELPGVTDVNEAINMIGKTPTLEFKLLDINATAETEDPFIETGLTGRYLDRARLEFSGAQQGGIGGAGEPYISLVFNREGSDLFAEITRNNVGQVLAIFLDGVPITTPVIREEITGGEAQITGTFSATEAREIVRDLNFGALPLPISLANTQSIGPTLGEQTLNAGVRAGIIGFVCIILFMILWYRLPGLVAAVALCSYIVFVLSLFKLIPVTLTSAGIAGFILSVGMAVDANVLIFERFKEELRKGRSLHDSIREGFTRAWPSIRDSNLSSLITAITLYYLGTSVVQGFALTFGLGILMSMFSALVIARVYMFAISPANPRKGLWLFGSGIKK